tara:strand:- start:712 stop:1347 length:636 start_codon:yes stop_codon:yes gene_type:complete
MSEKYLKICGVRTEEIANHAVAAHADFLGFIFYPPSPRNISLKDSSKIIHKIKDKISTVAVTVDPDDYLIAKVIEIGFPIIQLHGNESVERVREIRSSSSLQIIKSFGIEDESDLEKTKGYEEYTDYLLFDAKPREKDLPGGNAKSFEWSCLKDFNSKKKFFLSGGLNLENIETAINSRLTNLFDASSCMETSPGIKDKELISSFIAKVKT